MRRFGDRSVSPVACALFLALLAGCTSDGDAEPPATSGAAASGTPAAGEPVALDVFVYNVEYGGDRSTDAVIRDIDADIVGVLESYNRLPEIAENTGYEYYNTSLQILSRYPIHEPSGAEGRYAFIEVRPGEIVAFFNIHLDYVDYGPRLLENGASLREVLASERRIRLSPLELPLDQMRGLIAEGTPVFFTGDHNTPSSLDYGEETVGSRPGIDQPIRWPVSEALLEVGFRDTYREIHPDPLATPGITQDSTGDRIDYIYAAGPSDTLDSNLVGEEGGPDVDVGFDPWTSDHRAIVSSFEVTPAAMPTIVSVARALRTEGDALTIATNASDGEGSVAIVPAGEDGASPIWSQDRTATAETFDVDSADLGPGAFDALMLAAAGTELARVSFWVRDPDAEIRVSTDRGTYRSGDPVEVSWTDGPANRWDWIGVYEAARSDPRVDDYLVWNYTDQHASGTVPPSVAGSVTMDGTAQGRPWPLPPGNYVVHYLVTDRYRSIGSSAFEVRG